MSRPKLYASLILTLVAILILATAAFAQGPDRVVGHWQAPDGDGSTVSITLAGPPGGPFHVTWTDTFWTLCDGTRQGLGQGTAVFTGANTLDLSVDFECFTTGATASLQATLTYDPAAETLTPSGDPNVPGVFTRPGGP